MNKEYILSRDLFQDIPRTRGTSIGIMFGRESTGLTNAEVGMRHHMLTCISIVQYYLITLGEDFSKSLGLLDMDHLRYRCPQIARADKILTIDASPDYPVLNLGQSAAVVAYELYQGRMVAVDREGQRSGRPGGEEREGQWSETWPESEVTTRGDNKGVKAERAASGGSQELCTKAGHINVIHAIYPKIEPQSVT